MFVQAPKPQGGFITQFAFPIKFSDFEFHIERAAPARGEHSAVILRELDYSEEKIANLEAEEVI